MKEDISFKATVYHFLYFLVYVEFLDASSSVKEMDSDYLSICNPMDKMIWQVYQYIKIL